MDKLQYKKERHHSLYHKNQCLSFVTYSLVCLCIDAFYTKNAFFITGITLYIKTVQYFIVSP